MNSWSKGAARMAAVVTVSGSVIVGVGGTARADGYTSLPIGKVGEVLVDGARQRVVISDPSTGKIIETDYSGTVAVAKEGYSGVEDLLLSPDGKRLYAAWPGGNAIVAFDPADLSEITRYDVGSSVSPHTLAWAGGLIWFGYQTGGDKGGVGSLDPRGDSPKVALDDGTEKWVDAPLLAATANRPGILAVAGRVPAQGDVQGEMAVYDVTGDAPLRTARIDFWNKPAEIALTPDGSTLLYPWNDTLVSRRTSDLAETSTPLVMTHTANAVDVAADGTIAGGSWAPYDPDVFVFTAGGTPIRQYELPDKGRSSFTSDTLDYGALAWDPDGDQLFGVAYNDEDAYSLSRLAAPKKSVPVLTLAGPTTAKRAAALTMTGKLTASLAVPPGAAVSVARTDPESPNGRALSAVTTGAGGAFTVKDTPPAGGTVTYRVSYAGDATHEAAVATWSVQVAKSTPTLTLNHKNNTVYAYGTKVSFTAHLGGAYSNRTVAIWADPYGSDLPNKLIRKAAVNSKGDLTTTVTMTRNTKVAAVFAGDTRIAARSVSVTVLANVKISQTVKGHYKTAKIGSTKYHFLHARTDPRFVTTMSYHKGRSQYVSVEYYADGRWNSWGYAWAPLASNGTSTVYIGGTHQKNLRMRVRAGYLPGDGNSGDTLNHTTYTPWSYFIFTK